MNIIYSVNFINHSKNTGDFCLYQTPPAKVPNAMPLVWKSKCCNPNTELDIEWTIDYGAVWCESGDLSPGCVFKASENKNVDPAIVGQNSVLLSLNEGAYLFKSSMHNVPAGSLGIYTDGKIPCDDVSIGISMAGKATFAVMAEPNSCLQLTPTPQYWAAFGNFKQGKILNLLCISNSVEIVFPINKYHINLELNEANEWNQTALRLSNEAIRRRLKK